VYINTLFGFENSEERKRKKIKQVENEMIIYNQLIEGQGKKKVS